jgi:hypothetical protein
VGLVLPVAVDIGSHAPNFHTKPPLGELVSAAERPGPPCGADDLHAAFQPAGFLYQAIGVAGPFGDDWLSVGAMKFYADGSLIGGTAAFSAPYGEHAQLPGALYWDRRRSRKPFPGLTGRDGRSACTLRATGPSR